MKEREWKVKETLRKGGNKNEMRVQEKERKRKEKKEDRKREQRENQKRRE